MAAVEDSTLKHLVLEHSYTLIKWFGITENILISCRIPRSHRPGMRFFWGYFSRNQITTWTEKYWSNWVGTATVTRRRSETWTHCDKDQVEKNVLTDNERRKRFVFHVSEWNFLLVFCLNIWAWLWTLWWPLTWAWWPWRWCCRRGPRPCRGCRRRGSGAAQAQWTRGQPSTQASRSQLKKSKVTKESSCEFPDQKGTRTHFPMKYCLILWNFLFIYFIHIWNYY